MKNKDEHNFLEDELLAIRNNITSERKKKGLTQVELAQKMGVTQRVISYYENEAKTITFDAVAQIAKALDIPKRKILDTGHDQDELPNLPKALQKKISKISQLSPRSQRTISDMIDTMIKAEEL